MKNDRVVALTVGVACHLSFSGAIALMTYQVYFGFTREIYPIGGAAGRLWNLALLAQFPLLHSFLLTKRGRRRLISVFPTHLGERLATTTYALIASLQLMAIFALWTPTETVWFAPTGAARALGTVLYALAWLFLVKAIADTSLALHTGYLGWSAVMRGRPVVFPPPSERGTCRSIRQPIYLAFALILLCGPVWSPDHAALAGVWGLYCIFGPRLKERRLAEWYGEQYRRYQRAVPYMVPRLWSRAPGYAATSSDPQRGARPPRSTSGDPSVRSTPEAQ